jgi:hypothetical protein
LSYREREPPGARPVSQHQNHLLGESQPGKKTVLIFSCRGTSTAWCGGQHQARTGTIILRELPPKTDPLRSHGLIPIAERKYHAHPCPRTVHPCIHNETTHEADRPAHRIDGVRRVRSAALCQHQTAVGRPLLPCRLAVLIGSLPYEAATERPLTGEKTRGE